LEDSENTKMAFYFTTHSTFQAGADGACLRCLDLVNKGKSHQKHTNGCPSNSTQKNESELHNTAGNIGDAKGDDKAMLRQKNESELHMTAGATGDVKSDDKSMLHKKVGVTNSTL
jgi:hypothetical protein